MEQYVIKGGNPLVGDVEIAGAKNAALPILAAAAMTDETKAVKIFKGEAKLTTDTTVTEGKTYYKKVGNGYVVGTPETNPKTEGFYEIS